jgi:hypothetical protein
MRDVDDDMANANSGPNEKNVYSQRVVYFWLGFAVGCWRKIKAEAGALPKKHSNSDVSACGEFFALRRIWRKYVLMLVLL